MFFFQINPTHTIPTLLDINGSVIYDSHAIIIYLIEKYATNDQLYPSNDLLKRAHINERLYFDTGNLFARFRFVFEPILYQGCDEIPQVKLDYMERAYVLLEEILKRSDDQYLVGNTLTIADITCANSILGAEIVLKINSEKFPKITEWIKRLSTHSYFNQLIEGVNEFDVVLQKMLNKNKENKNLLK